MSVSEFFSSSNDPLQVRSRKTLEFIHLTLNAMGIPMSTHENELINYERTLIDRKRTNATDWFGRARDLMEDDRNKMTRSLIYKKVDLCSPVVKMAGCGEDSKEKLLSFLVDVAAFGGDDMKQLCRFLAEMVSFWEDCSPHLVEMEDSENKYLYRFLVRIANSVTDIMKKQLVGIADSWNDKLGTVNEEISMNSLLIVMADLGQDNKERLFTSLIGMVRFWNYYKEKLYISLIGKGDVEFEKKIKLYSLVDWMTDFCTDKKKEDLYNLLVSVEDPWKYNKKTLYESLIHEMADFGEDERETVYSLVVEMADAWEHTDKKMLYSLLVRVWEEDKVVYKEEEVQGLVVEISDLWEDNEKLQSLLVEVSQDIRIVDHSMVVEMADLWEGNLINKVKLHSWLANKTHNLEPNRLFRLLLHLSLFRNEDNTYTKYLTDVRDHLGTILDIITEKTLEEEEEWKLGEEGSSLSYFLYEVLEIAHDARHFLIQILDSDPIVLLSQIFNAQDYRRNIIACDFNPSLRNMSLNVMQRLQKFVHQAIRVRKSLTAKTHVGEFSTWKEGENLVGLEEDIKLLLEDIHTVTYIRGMGGIGKTTLARELYNHPALVNQFECRLWICVSQQLSHKELIIKLLRQVVDGKEFETDMSFEKMDNKSLIAMLHQHLQCMRYFIVLDDVQRDLYMNGFFEALPIDKGSRLMFTTRIPRVRFSSHEVYTEHKMKFLDENKSWELLLKTLFFGTNDQRFPKQLEKRGRRVLAQCSGLPLAIKEVGRRWAEMIRSGSKWEELLESIDLSATLKVLDRTYQSFSHQMKLHFLHLSFFKEGTTIRVKKLEHILAVAIPELGVSFSPSDLFDLSEESIIEFKNTTKTENEFKMCRITPVFQRLSITKAHDEISLEILNKDGNNRCSHEPRHRVIYCSREKFDYSTNQDRHLVSLFFHGGGYFNTSPSYWKNFEQLKILEMEDFGLKILPDAVGTLLELRYLGLRNNYIQELPPSLGHLKRLKVLDIAQNFMVEVPNILWEMDEVRHLYMSGIISCQQPLKIDWLLNLETLSYISVYSWIHELPSLKTLVYLRRLGIEEVDRDTDVSKLFASLAKLLNLSFLTLRGFCFRRMPPLDELGILQKLSTLKLDGLLTKLPSVGNFPPNITCLSLVNSCLDEDPMPILEKLPHLCKLKLENAYTGRQMVISPNGFVHLIYLYIGELWHLRSIVQVGEGGMSKLEELEINSCPYLETLPEEVWSKELKMVTTKNIATKLRKSRFTSGMRKVDIQP